MTFINKQPLISVVITTFNRKNLLKETLDSIQRQSFTDFEIIIVDNYSEDKTKNFILNHPNKKIRFYQNKNDGIIAINRNFGIKKAKGKYIAFCDDDDLWETDKLHRQIDYIKHHNISLCYSNAKSFNDNGIICEKCVRRVVKKRHYKELLWGNYIPNSSVIVLKKCFKDLGMLNEENKIREDYDMWLRISEKYLIGGLDESLISYRIHSKNNAFSRNKETLKSIRTLLNIKDIIFISNIRFFFVISFHSFKFIFYFMRENFLLKNIFYK